MFLSPTKISIILTGIICAIICVVIRVFHISAGGFCNAAQKALLNVQQAIRIARFFLTLIRLFTYCNRTLHDAPLGLIGNPVKIGSGPAAVIGDERRN